MSSHESQLLYEQIVFDVLEIILTLMNSYVYLFSILEEFNSIHTNLNFLLLSYDFNFSYNFST